MGRRKPSRQSQPHSRLTKYLGIRRIERSTPARNVPRKPGQTKKFVKGSGTKVWVGKNITRDGWISEKKYNEMRKR